MSSAFTGLAIDDAPELLEASYRLRYQVYCLERKFLPAGDYPDEREVDLFDGNSVHVGTLDATGRVVATARLIELSDRGLPLLDHCALFPGMAAAITDPTRRVVEVSRLSVSRDYNRRVGDDFYSLQGATNRVDHPERRTGGEIVISLYKALYQATKRRGFTHWVVATERSLQRLVAKFGFPFNAVGPETDYYGLVAPYLMDIHEFDMVITSGRIALLEEFLLGLEAEFRPAEGDPLTPVVTLL